MCLDRVVEGRPRRGIGRRRPAPVRLVGDLGRPASAIFRPPADPPLFVGELAENLGDTGDVDLDAHVPDAHVPSPDGSHHRGGHAGWAQVARPHAWHRSRANNGPDSGPSVTFTAPHAWHLRFVKRAPLLR